MTIRELLDTSLIRLDGGMGTMLAEAGLQPGEESERWNITHPSVIQEIHRAYYEAGSHIVLANTFGANRLRFSKDELKAVITAGIENACRARDQAKGQADKFVALDIGPCGRLLRPLGDFDFEEAIALYSEVVQIGTAAGADLVFIETMSDSYETKAAVLSAKEMCDLPVFVSNTYGQDGRLMTGATPEAMAALLEGLGVDALGANCSLGPEALAQVVRRILKVSNIPVLLKPNAGLPKSEHGKTVYDVEPEAFARSLARLAEEGVRIVGGCCGTTPAYIRRLTEETAHLSVRPIEKKRLSVASSYTHAVCFGEEPVLIGERLNPTGKKRLKEALKEGRMDYLLTEALNQAEAGAHVLDVNVGLPELDEADMLGKVIYAVQSVTDLPLQIDTADPKAMEKAMRLYNGKPLLNSVNGKSEVMDKVFPLAKKYGALVVALTLDEGGIPDTVQGRVAVAERILAVAETYGLEAHDLLFDALTLTVSADKNAATVTLETIRALHQRGLRTILGVSNVSFGLPERETVTAAFFTMALTQGLSGAIVNPLSEAMMRAFYAYRALSGLDDNCCDYLGFVQGRGEKKPPEQEIQALSLREAIVRGMGELAGQLAKEALSSCEPLAMLERDVIPALDEVGRAFEEKRVYLPQLLMAAEAAQSAFEQAAAVMPKGMSDGPAFVLATVQGDVHDIGKNIVRLLLSNYGVTVYDLGKDVAPETIAEAVKEHHAPFCGLSALMTTTVPSMEKTIALLRLRAPDCRIVVGGAVLNHDYAKAIGADFYAKDAMETVRFVTGNA